MNKSLYSLYYIKMPSKPYYRKRKYIRRRRIIRRRPVSGAVKRYVKKIIHSNIENKTKMNYAANQTITTGDSVTSTYPLLMNIVQGTGEADRIGNSIKCVKGQMKVCVNLKPYSTTSNPNAQPTWVRVMVLRDLRTTGQLATMDATAWGNLFRTNNTTVGIQGNPLDTVLGINTDFFRVCYNSVFKLGIGNHISGPTNPSSYFDNSPAAKQLTINWGKFCKKQLKFTEGINYPSNDNLYIVFTACAADGTASSTKDLIEIHYANYQHFEDA